MFHHRAQADFEGGFTLLEMLVVLTIIAMIYAVTIPQYAASSNSDLRIAAVNAIARLRSIRSHALQSNRPISISFEGGTARVDPRTALTMPSFKGTKFEIHETDETVTAGNGYMTFFEDGSASGGRIVVMRGGASCVINVNRVTGSSTLESCR